MNTQHNPLKCKPLLSSLTPRNLPPIDSLREKLFILVDRIFKRGNEGHDSILHTFVQIILQLNLFPADYINIIIILLLWLLVRSLYWFLQLQNVISDFNSIWMYFVFICSRGQNNIWYYCLADEARLSSKIVTAIKKIILSTQLVYIIRFSEIFVRWSTNILVI